MIHCVCLSCRAYIAPGKTKKTGIDKVHIFDNIEEACNAAARGFPDHLRCLDDASAPTRKKPRGAVRAGAVEPRSSSSRATKEDPPEPDADDAAPDNLLDRVLRLADVLDPELAKEVRDGTTTVEAANLLVVKKLQEQRMLHQHAGRTLCNSRTSRKRGGAATAASSPTGKSRKTSPVSGARNG